MKNNIILIFCFFLFSTPLYSQKREVKSLFPYQNPALSTPQRVADLMTRMTLQEKVAQTQCIWSQEKKKIMNNRGEFSDSLAVLNFSNGLGQVGRPNETFGNEYLSKSLNARETALLSNRIQKFFVEKTRLGIPVMFHEESLHGNQAKDATNFPSHLGMGATWDENLLTEVYSAVAKEVRLRGAQQVLAPVVDLGRDPRWGRTEETLGEDPYHVSRMAVAEIKAYQGNTGDRIDKTHVVSTLKHFGVHGQPENGSNIGASFCDERSLREVFFPPFEACVKSANALSVMPCYNELNGTPAHANKWLLTDILRKEWGFKGIITSDYGGISDLRDVHFVAQSSMDAAQLALEAGVDIETPYSFAYTFQAISTLLENGKLPLRLVDETVARILTVKFNLGLFDDPYTNPEEAERVVGCDAHRKLAQRAAEEAVVLLKNRDHLLPISLSQYKKIAVIGPNANRCVLGGYSDAPKFCVTPLDGIKARVGAKAEVFYSEGCRLTDNGSWFADPVVLSNPEENRQRIQEAVKVALQSEVVLLFVGGNEVLAREAWSTKHQGDLTDLELKGEQNELIAALKATGKPIVAVLNSGQPLSFKKLDEQVGTILQAWYMGQEGGTAIARILFGDVAPSGKLPMSIARSAGHLPVFYNHKPSSRSRSYLLDDISPLYPFGHGLSYTTFAYSNLKLSADKVKNGENVTVSVDVKNSGDKDADEVVQCYIRDEFSSVTRPVKELKDFMRTSLKAGETKTITFLITPDKLSFYNLSMKKVVENGKFKVMVGTSSVDNQSVGFEVY